jgi:hypothetical protein
MRARAECSPGPAGLRARPGPTQVGFNPTHLVPYRKGLGSGILDAPSIDLPALLALYL